MPNVSFPQNNNATSNRNNNINNINYETGMEVNAIEGLNTTMNMNVMNNANIYQSISLDIDRLMLFSYNIQKYFNGNNYNKLNIASNVNFDTKKNKRLKNKPINAELNAFQEDFQRYTTDEKNAFRKLIRVVSSVSHKIGLSKQNGRITEDKLKAMHQVFLAIKKFTNTLSNGSKRTFFVKNIDRKTKKIEQMLVNQTVQGMTNVGPSVSTDNGQGITNNNTSYFKSTMNPCVPLYKERDELIIKIFKKCPNLLPSQIPLSCDDIRKIRNFVMTQCKHNTNKINLKR